MDSTTVTKPTEVNIHALAEFVIRYCGLNQVSITNLKLQKLLYYIQAWHLAYFNKHPLFDVRPEAWVNGPVYREIYTQYKPYGFSEISLSSSKLSSESYQDSLKALNLNEEQEKYLQSVLDNYGSKSAEELVIRSHNEKPWNEARENCGPLDSCDNPISHEMMYNYYSKLINRK